MSAVEEVRRFLDRWANLAAERDHDKHADLYARDPAPLVVFSDGERADDWLDVRVRLERDFSRISIERVEIHDVDVRELTDDVVLVSYGYDLRARDLWGTASTIGRRATMTLLRTKDGFRIAAAHFARATE